MDTALANYVHGDDGKRSLVKKLATVLGKVGRVAKTGRNKFHGYDYATEADIVDSVREHMAAESLMMVPHVVGENWGELERSKGQKERLVTLTVRFTIYDGDSGEQIWFEVKGEGQDPADKATYKAMTGAVKYALLKLFLIPTGDDPEQDQPQQKGNGQHQGQNSQQGQQGKGQQSQRQQQGQQQGERRAPSEQAPRESRPAAGQETAALVAHGGDVIGWGKWSGVRLSTATVEQVRECVEDIKAALASGKAVHNAEQVRATQTALAKWLVARQATPRTPPVMTYGQHKGKEVAALTDGELAGAIDAGNAKLQEKDAGNAPWASALKKCMADVEAEVKVREQRKARKQEQPARQPGEGA